MNTITTNLQGAISLTLLRPADWKELDAILGEAESEWLRFAITAPKAGAFAVFPSEGRPAAFAVIDEVPNLWSAAHLPAALPPREYAFRCSWLGEEQLSALALGWALAGYRFDRHVKEKKPAPARLAVSENIRQAIEPMHDAICMARDLINEPANIMDPAGLAGAARGVAEAFGAEYQEVVGDDLLAGNYPAIHAVGRASAIAPRLAEFRWGPADAPKVTLVGKGVCFDSGGLDIKSAGNMKIMKKDMGGAAIALALARLVMEAGLPVRLRVLLPIVENGISGDAFRPGDIIQTRAGMTVEIGNTDAEGRLILSDALWEADQEMPALLIDMATLTGASRVALGTDVPSFFTPDDRLAEDLARLSAAECDQLWRLPLWDGYASMLASDVADINNAPDSSYGGAITAALFLKRFVTNTKAWIHMDVMAWNVSDRPGRPRGGEAQGLRALFALVKYVAARA